MVWPSLSRKLRTNSKTTFCQSLPRTYKWQSLWLADCSLYYLGYMCVHHYLKHWRPSPLSVFLGEVTRDWYCCKLVTLIQTGAKSYSFPCHSHSPRQRCRPEGAGLLDRTLFSQQSGTKNVEFPWRWMWSFCYLSAFSPLMRTKWPGGNTDTYIEVFAFPRSLSAGLTYQPERSLAHRQSFQIPHPRGPCSSLSASHFFPLSFLTALSFHNSSLSP